MPNVTALSLARPPALSRDVSKDVADDDHAQCLVEIVELKWLMAGHGVKLHVERLQADPEYARRTLACAGSLPNAALRAAATRLQHALGLDKP